MSSLHDVPESDRWRTTIAVWQIFGGLFSVVAFLDAMSPLGGPSAATRAVCVIGVCAALLGVWSGFQLRKRRTSGIHTALIVQALQLVGFSTGSTCFQLTLGPFAYLTLIWGQRYALEFGMRPTLRFFIDSPDAPAAGAAINLLALFCFVRLLFWELPTTPTATSVGVQSAISLEGRALAAREREVLGLVQSEWGPQNTEQSVQYASNGEAQLWVRDLSGERVMFLSVTNLAEWHREGTLSREKLLEWIRGPRAPSA